MKRIIALLLSISTVLAMCSTICMAKEFPDVDSSHWALPYIDKLSDEGIINGYNDGTYKPQGTVKRSEFLKLVMASCMPSDIEFEDVPEAFDHWAGSYVWLAETYSIINKGEYTLKNIEEPITRLEMARMVANADLRFLHPELKKSEEDVLFIDIGELNAMDVALVEHCVASGLIKGYEDGTFKPEKTMTRAEAATMIYRFNGYENKGE